MKVKLNQEVISHLLVIFIVGTGLWVGRSWPSETGLFPRTVGTIIILIAALSLFMELRKKKQIEKDPGEDKPVLTREILKKARTDFGWLAGYIAAIWLLGYVPASVIYVFLYMKIKGKQRWLPAIMITIGAFAFMKVVFGILLGIRWFPGAILRAAGLA